MHRLFLNHLSKVSLFTLTLIFALSSVNATHIIELRMDVSTTGKPNEYKVVISEVIACDDQANREFDVDIYYESVACGYKGEKKIVADWTTGKKIIRTCLGTNTDCDDETTDGVILYTFSGIITLPDDNCEYEFSYRSPGTRSSSDNLVIANTTEKFYTYTNVTNGILNNTSPSFNIAGAPVFCAGKDYAWKVDATDPDADDSLVYSLESCMAYDRNDATKTGYSIDTIFPGYKVPYSYTSPWGTPLTISPSTGIIEFTAPNVDGVYWVCVRVDEYRGGVLIGSNKLETRVFISTNCNNAGSNDAPVWVDDPDVPNPDITLPAVGIPCEQSKATATFDKAIQYGSWALDTSDIILKDELGNVVTDAIITPINIVHNLFTQIEVQLDSQQFENTFYDLTILSGNDGNTLFSECGDAMAANSTIQLVVYTCVVIPVTITNVTVESEGCSDSHLIEWEVDDLADLTDPTLMAAFNNWEVLACDNSLTSSCTQIGTTSASELDIEEYSYTTSGEAISYRIRAIISGPTTQLFSNIVNSIQLKIDDNTPDLDYADLSWSPYNGWEDPIYQIQLSTDTTNWITAEESTNPFFSFNKPGEIGTVYIRIATTDGTFTSYSNCVSYDGSGRELIVPDIFSPNGDGVNDLFAIGNLKYWPGTYLSVFNRWGTHVFRQENYQGTWTANRVSDGIYFYILHLNNRTKVTGYVTITR